MPATSQVKGTILAARLAFSPRDPDRVFLEMGRASAEVNLSGPQRLFVRRGDPHHLLGFTEAIYGYYYSVGRRSYQPTGPNSGTLVTEDAESVPPGDCLTVIGWHERAIEMSGGQGVRIQHPVCRARGGDRCEYRCSWESAG